MGIDPLLKSRLRRTGDCIVTSGAEGETLTQILLDFSDVGWFAVSQGKSEKSQTLRLAGAKRIDFVVGWNGNSLLLDTKCYSPLRIDEDGTMTYGLTDVELMELRATGEMFGMTVAVIIWHRKHPQEIYVIETIDAFQDEDVVFGEPGRSTRFEQKDICHLIDKDL